MPNQSELKTQLHLTFVEMLFALAIGQIAIDLSRLIDYQLASTETLLTLLPAYSHLLLAFFVISTSWVGWRTSEFSGTEIKNVFTLDYVELFVDVALVVMYFALARAVKIPELATTPFSPNASYEAWAVAVIITTYAVWDVVSSRTDFKTKLMQRWWASLVCMVIAWLLVAVHIGKSGTVSAVVWADCSLIALIFTFRAMKLHNFTEHTRKSVSLNVALLAAVGVCAFISTR